MIRGLKTENWLKDSKWRILKFVIDSVWLRLLCLIAKQTGIPNLTKWTRGWEISRLGLRISWVSNKQKSTISSPKWTCTHLNSIRKLYNLTRLRSRLMAVLILAATSWLTRRHHSLASASPSTRTIKSFWPWSKSLISNSSDRPTVLTLSAAMSESVWIHSNQWRKYRRI